jgi:hypothetical protein
MSQWTLRSTMRRPSDDNENVLLFERSAANSRPSP